MHLQTNDQRIRFPAPSPISLQLFTLRREADADLRVVLGWIADVGFMGVELVGLHGDSPSRVRGWLDETGLTLHSAHTRLPVGAEAEAVLDEHSELGKPVLIANASDFATLDAIARLADGLNEAAQAAAGRGMSVGYHNHHAECANRFGGRSAYEMLVEQLDERVMLELHIYWAAVGGADPATVLRDLGERARFVHVKDGPLDPAEPMTTVGAGRIDVVDALTASDAVAWHIVEIDRVEGDMHAAVVDSYRYPVEAGLSRGLYGNARRNHSVR